MSRVDVVAPHCMIPMAYGGLTWEGCNLTNDIPIVGVSTVVTAKFLCSTVTRSSGVLYIWSGLFPKSPLFHNKRWLFDLPGSPSSAVNFNFKVACSTWPQDNSTKCQSRVAVPCKIRIPKSPVAIRILAFLMFSGWWLQPIWKILYRQIGKSSPKRGENKKYSKPPPSLCWVHGFERVVPSTGTSDFGFRHGSQKTKTSETEAHGEKEDQRIHKSSKHSQILKKCEMPFWNTAVMWCKYTVYTIQIVPFIRNFKYMGPCKKSLASFVCLTTYVSSNVFIIRLSFPLIFSGNAAIPLDQSTQKWLNFKGTHFCVQNKHRLKDRIQKS